MLLSNIGSNGQLYVGSLGIVFDELGEVGNLKSDGSGIIFNRSNPFLNVGNTAKFCFVSSIAIDLGKGSTVGIG